MTKAVIDYVSLKPKDFLSDEDFIGWGADVCGAYCCLIFALYTNNGRLENDPDRLRLLAHWQGDGWEEAWNKLRRKFSETSRGLKHKRVTRELARARKRSQDARGAALRRWEKQRQSQCDPTKGAMPREGKGREGKEATPPTPQGGEPGGFLKWWAAYPRRSKGGRVLRVSRKKCLVKWRRERLEAKATEILQCLERSRRSTSWQRDGMQFVWNSYRFLSEAPWDDPGYLDDIGAPSVEVLERRQRVIEQRRQEEAGQNAQQAKLDAAWKAATPSQREVAARAAAGKFGDGWAAMPQRMQLSLAKAELERKGSC